MNASSIFTIGHSTRSIEEFIQLLVAHQINLLGDIRTIPRSRHNPQFNFDVLPKSLKTKEIEYIHFSDLGGLRKTTVLSPNKGWRNASFRGFADYMQTPGFITALERVIELSKTKRIALMCAEAVPWRCHRSLVADALIIRGISTCDIQSAKECRPHVLTSFARVEGSHITYPPEEDASQD